MCNAATYSGPMSLLPELLNAPRRTASGFNGSATSMVGTDVRCEDTIGDRKTASPATVVTTAVRNLFFGVRNDMSNWVDLAGGSPSSVTHTRYVDGF